MNDLTALYASLCTADTILEEARHRIQSVRDGIDRARPALRDDPDMQAAWRLQRAEVRAACWLAMMALREPKRSADA